LQKLIAGDAAKAILAIEYVGRASIWVLYRNSIWKRFDPARALLAVVAIADNAQDGPSVGLESDSRASTRCDDRRFPAHVLAIIIRLPSLSQTRR
jgi:hypothetical protein